ncbi:hypothetical protein CDL12_03063 [Handroanthus impetiginosus]|uniref:BRI1 kinase inhibitor 1 n=1 Tax=Handroanthus impetiginosus TaxID=429701 RepID=A0A2G9I365_9LAMI|nr:hypothetical protein CDL12_03063 [Handroanthus impetiginosus]
MEIQHQILNYKTAEEEKQQKQPPQLTPVAASPPHSSSSSPSHEFSFTISLHPSTAGKILDKKTKSSPPFAIDLSPADEIFFHGHLLPLHLLSHLPTSPRTSTTSLDHTFTLPIKDSVQNNNNIQTTPQQNISQISELKGRAKSKSFSLFGKAKSRKDEEIKDIDQQKRKSKFQGVKRYMRLVLIPFLRRRDPEFQPRSYSGNLRVRNKKEIRGRKGEFSAPASMRTSPGNSGVLMASGIVNPSTSDSTMEELQAAIQAAIAHCKKSIAAEDEVKVP